MHHRDGRPWTDGPGPQQVVAAVAVVGHGAVHGYAVGLQQPGGRKIGCGSSAKKRSQGHGEHIELGDSVERFLGGLAYVKGFVHGSTVAQGVTRRKPSSGSVRSALYSAVIGE